MRPHFWVLLVGSVLFASECAWFLIGTYQRITTTDVLVHDTYFDQTRFAHLLAGLGLYVAFATCVLGHAFLRKPPSSEPGAAPDPAA